MPAGHLTLLSQSASSLRLVPPVHAGAAAHAACPGAGRGTKLELVPTDAQHGKPGDWAYIVSEFKTPPRIQVSEQGGAVPCPGSRSALASSPECVRVA